MIPLPDPPLRGRLDAPLPAHHAGGLDLLLRPWHREDARALVAAWDDAEIQRWTGVPERRELGAAHRWIAGDRVRRERWLSLDLVVERGGAVAGEVGLSSFDRVARTAEIGWWTAVEHRGRGVASVAAALLVSWARGTLDVSVLARCDEANPASLAVARRSGAKVLL